jgi:hypothetical protein
MRGATDAHNGPHPRRHTGVDRPTTGPCRSSAEKRPAQRPGSLAPRQAGTAKTRKCRFGASRHAWTRPCARVLTGSRRWPRSSLMLCSKSYHRHNTSRTSNALIGSTHYSSNSSASTLTKTTDTELHQQPPAPIARSGLYHARRSAAMARRRRSYGDIRCVMRRRPAAESAGTPSWPPLSTSRVAVPVLRR